MKNIYEKKIGKNQFGGDIVIRTAPNGKIWHRKGNTVSEVGGVKPATATELGGVKVGTGLSVTADGTLSASGGGGSKLSIGNITCEATSSDLGFIRLDAHVAFYADVTYSPAGFVEKFKTPIPIYGYISINSVQYPVISFESYLFKNNQFRIRYVGEGGLYKYYVFPENTYPSIGWNKYDL